MFHARKPLVRSACLVAASAASVLIVTVGLAQERGARLEVAAVGQQSSPPALNPRHPDSYTVQRGEGWLDNAFNGEEIGELDQTALRGTIEFTPNDDVDILLVGSYARDKSDSAGREHVGFLDGAFSPNLCAAALRGERDEGVVQATAASPPSPGDPTLLGPGEVL